jgi:glucosyl-dolichyl phosphate glucuronosyltransferase
MKISVVLCTYNNAESLKETLKDIRRNVCDSANVELLVVDNNSTDHSKQVITEQLEAFPFPAEYLFEPTQGLSHARNTGLNNARGEYILFTDDDAAIPTNWVAEYLKVIKQEQPDCLFSKIAILWDKPKPEWFINAYLPYFVHLDYGERSLTISDKEHEFFGKNFCVRTLLLKKMGGFNPKLGRCGTKLVAGEETAIYKYLISARKKVIYFPDAQVGHRLKDREYELTNMIKMYTDSAYTTFTLSKMYSTKKIFGRPFYPLKSAIVGLSTSALKLVKESLLRQKNERLYAQMLVQRNVKLLGLWITNP